MYTLGTHGIAYPISCMGGPVAVVITMAKLAYAVDERSVLHNRNATRHYQDRLCIKVK